MKIWWINHHARPPTMAGGTRHYSFAKELVGRGHEVLIYACSSQHNIDQDLILSPGEKYKRQEFDGVKFNWLRGLPYGGNSFRRLMNMLVFSYRVMNRVGVQKGHLPDVIIGSSVHLFAPLAGIRLARLHDIPFVLEIRDIWPQTLIDIGGYSSWHPLIRLFGLIEGYLYRNSDSIITLLPNSKDYMVAKGAAEDKIAYIPNGIDLDLVPDPAEPVSTDSRLTLMYAGAHGIANNLTTVMSAAKILQDDGWADQVLIRLIGSGPEKAALQRLAKQEGLGNVIFEEPVIKAKLYRTLQEADAFIIPGRKAGLYQWGVSFNKLFDYLAAARPIIFAVEAANDPIRESGAGLSIPASDPVALADAVKQLCSMPPRERIAMGTRGRRYVEENHDISKLTDDLEEVLERVVHP